MRRVLVEFILPMHLGVAIVVAISASGPFASSGSASNSPHHMKLENLKWH